MLLEMSGRPGAYEAWFGVHNISESFFARLEEKLAEVGRRDVRKIYMEAGAPGTLCLV